MNSDAPFYWAKNQNCATFTCAGLIAGHAVENRNFSPVPNINFWMLSMQADFSYVAKQKKPAKEKVDHKIMCPDSKGNMVQCG
jgi:hypothetical protein